VQSANCADNLPADMQPVTQSEMHFSVSQPIFAYIREKNAKDAAAARRLSPLESLRK
jgi:hypothetical protein